MKFYFEVIGIFIVNLSMAYATIDPGKMISSNIDIGDPKIKGGIEYNPIDQAFIQQGAGSTAWKDRDACNFQYGELKGDFLLTANFEFIGQQKTPSKMGWMVRESLDDDAAMFTGTLHSNLLAVAQYRLKAGATMLTQPIDAQKRFLSILQVERQGDLYTFRAAFPGEPLKELGRQKMEVLGGNVFAGLFVSSQDAAVSGSARIWNVRVERHVPDNYKTKNNRALGSRLEVMDVFTGQRELVWESPNRFEAPNWTPDGTGLIINMQGRLYRIPVSGGEPEQIDTGFADRINNDHGISFDGRWMAISHSSSLESGDKGSAVYVLPLEGGTPSLVTERAPSYWHGWMPNNREVLYVAKRDPGMPFNIYMADIETRVETPITTFDYGHVDGPECDPRGDWIYYNGSQSGSMNIWRIRPDRTERQELTDDEYYDWFPHISPDGKWMVFLSYPGTIGLNAHPRYKKVMLRRMSLEDTEPKPEVIAYLFGGQGTINVPSWSPDSRKVAFVSYSR